MVQVKKPVVIPFKSLKESVAAPGDYLFTDGLKFGAFCTLVFFAEED